MKKLLIPCFMFATIALSAQEASTAKEVAIVPVDAAIIKQMAKDSPKKNTLFYTFGIWCEPCRLHVPTAIKLAKDYDLNFYVIIVDSQTGEKVLPAVSFLKEKDPNIKIAILRDEVYGVKTPKRNKKFVKEITPPQFENIEDFSKYILLNQQGEVIMVTTYKDNEGNDWRDDSKMVEKRIVPLLKG